ncbi:MAG: DUF370 domain-containing protein [Lachnospiraceae bacterium]|nr:DUF370 domain-containing protein [Lachnospiraceae bacterium]MEE1341940.1 DUF370 domain-containing protein [Lachnospiraceae bacterium]
MKKLINIGFGNIVNTDKIVSIVGCDAAPIKRMIQAAKDEARAVDATHGRKTKAAIITDSNHIILSALQPETIMSRLQGKETENIRGDEDE